MKIHEYQAKALLAEYGVPVPRGKVAMDAAAARAIAAELGGTVAVKSQVHAGGRGKAGGIKVANSPEEAERYAASLLGTRLVTAQTGKDGAPVNAVLIEEAVQAKQELYVGIVIDRSSGLPVIMGSAAGGMEIEEVAHTAPEKIIRASVHPAVGYQPFQGRWLAQGMGLPAELTRPATDLIGNLYRLFQSKDCSLLEINPLVITADNRLLALDAKINFDDNALYRRKDVEGLRDWDQEDPLEVRAVQSGINNYIKLDGNIGCIVNGAGLAMATLDVLKLAGGDAANFLDIGTVNSTDRVIAAFQILASDPAVKAVLVNIFGGMARVDVIAQGIVEAMQQMEFNRPIVTRLEGTNLAEGKVILAESGLNLIQAVDLGDAAHKAVAAAQG